MKYAIVQTSGKQFFLNLDSNKWHDVDLLKKQQRSNSNIVELIKYIYLNKVLLLRKNNQIKIGKPFLNTKLLALVLENVTVNKITVLKTKPKKKYTRVKGQKTKYNRIQLITK